jgi:hypothetical protein
MFVKLSSSFRVGVIGSSQGFLCGSIGAASGRTKYLGMKLISLQGNSHTAQAGNPKDILEWSHGQHWVNPRLPLGLVMVTWMGNAKRRDPDFLRGTVQP